MIFEDLAHPILDTLAYSDVFDYPLTASEVHRYLTGEHATVEAVAQALDGMVRSRYIAQVNEYFTLPNRESIVEIRKRRAKIASRLWVKAAQDGRILASLPFVRMVAVTGSLAVLNISRGADMDFMLVAEPGRLWTARAFAVVFGRWMRPSGHTICVNLLVSEDALAWPQHDLYSAREICQMIPVAGMNVYRRLRTANAWTESILPNSTLCAPDLVPVPSFGGSNRIQRLLELPLRGRLGAWLEQWAMKYQLRRIARRPGARTETKFTADVCQSNLHRHRHWTLEAFENRLSRLGLVPSPPLDDHTSRVDD